MSFANGFTRWKFFREFPENIDGRVVLFAGFMGPGQLVMKLVGVLVVGKLGGQFLKGFDRFARIPAFRQSHAFFIQCRDQVPVFWIFLEAEVDVGDSGFKLTETAMGDAATVECVNQQFMTELDDEWEIHDDVVVRVLPF